SVPANGASFNGPMVVTKPTMGSCNGAELSFPCLSERSASAAVASSSIASGIEAFDSTCPFIILHLPVAGQPDAPAAFPPGGAAKVWIRRGRRKRRSAQSCSSARRSIRPDIDFALSGLGAEVHRRGISTADDDRNALAGPRPIASGEDGGERRGAA